MLLERMKTLIALLLTVSMLAGCGDDKAYVHGEDLKQNTLVQDTNQLRNQIAEGNMLSASTRQDRQKIESILTDVRAAAITLQRNPHHKNALLLMVNSMRALTSRTYLQEDQFEMNKFAKNLSAQVQKYARIQGRNITDLEYVLYSYRFSGGLTPFGSFGWDNEKSQVAEGLKWSTREALDRWFTSVNVYTPSNFTPDNFESWLLTPTFDLTNVRNPKFRIRNGFNLDGKDPEVPLDAARILNESYMALVSTDYIDGDPNEATWKRVPLYTRLEGRNFDSGTSNIVDLSEYEGQKVVIAFAIKYEGHVHGAHSIGWTIEQFDFLGLGELGAIEGRSGKLYEHRFSRKDFSPFQMRNFISGGKDWYPSGYPPKKKPDGTLGKQYIDWMIVNPKKRTDITDTYLISPYVDLSGAQAPVLSINGTVRNPIFENMEILVSTSYDGSDPRSFGDWEKLAISKDGLEKPKSWNSYSWTFDISKYVDKKIAIAFHYKNDGTNGTAIWDLIENGTGASDGRNDRSGTVWQVNDLKIEGRGESLNFQKINLKVDSVE